MNKYLRLAICILLINSITVAVALDAVSDRKESVILMIDKIEAKSVYSVNGKQSAKGHGLLDLLSEQRSKLETTDIEIIILANENVSYAEVGNVLGITGKAGFTKYKLYVFGKDKKWMLNVKYGSAIRFTKDL